MSCICFLFSSYCTDFYPQFYSDCLSLYQDYLNRLYSIKDQPANIQLDITITAFCVSTIALVYQIIQEVDKK